MSKRNKSEEKESKRIKAPGLNLSAEAKRGIAVVIFVLLGAVSLLAAMNLAGGLGKFLFKILTWGFGYLAFAFPFLMFLIAVLLGKHHFAHEQGKDKSFYLRIYLGSFLLLSSIAGIVHLFNIKNGANAFVLAGDGKAGGFLGALFSVAVFKPLSFTAGLFVLIALLVIGILVAFNVSLKIFWFKRQEEEPGAQIEPTKTPEIKINSMGQAGFAMDKLALKNKRLPEPEKDEEEKPKILAKPAIKIGGAAGGTSDIKLEAITIADRKDWKLPPFDILEEGQDTVDSGNIELNVAIIKKTLADFGIEVDMGEVNVGPTVTQYTLRPAQGVRLSQIAALQDNLSLELAARSIRMELPIPGKPLVGIEVPNRTVTIVRLRDVIKTREFVEHKSKLAFALGRDVAGMPMVADLAKMPHMLIAGATNMGKSVSINSLFISLLYRNTPQDVKFIVIDPKKVELNLYNGIPHLLTPVVTDYEKAVNALKWAVAEMDRRYKLLAESHKRNISEYNEAATLKIPFIVILVDELADLMAVAQADVEAAVVRLAQMARAVGIHLVLATQRPSVDIITGLIKANITARIAFAVASQIDSRTILDTAGAEKLLGNGDMLFISAEFNKPRRIQGAYIGEKEVKRVVDFFKTQAGAVIYNEEILEKPKKPLEIPGFEGQDSAGGDELLEEATEEVRRAGKASASLLQRRLRIGYARAARILDLMEAKGIIGPGEGAKPRDVYGVSDSERQEYGGEDIQD